MSKLAPWLTRPPLAVRVAEFALRLVDVARDRPIRILEPSAGKGALIEGLIHAEAALADIQKRAPRAFEITAIELHRGRARVLAERFPQITIVNRCFVTWFEDTYEAGWTPDRPRPFDLVLANPPFDDGQDADHVDPMTRLAERSVVLLRTAFLHGTTDRARIFDEVRCKREAVLRSRPSFDDDENGKEGGPRHEFTVFDFERPTTGWRRARGEVDRVTREWWD